MRNCVPDVPAAAVARVLLRPKNGPIMKAEPPFRPSVRGSSLGGRPSSTCRAPRVNGNSRREEGEEGSAKDEEEEEEEEGPPRN